MNSIVGLRQYQITFTGEQNHAGSTSMVDRKDAVAHAIAFGHAITQRMEGVVGDGQVHSRSDL